MVSTMKGVRLAYAMVIGLLLAACASVPPTADEIQAEPASVPMSGSNASSESAGSRRAPNRPEAPRKAAPCKMIDEPLTDQDGDGELTERDFFLREYAYIRRGENICITHGKGREIQRVAFDFDQVTLKAKSITILDEAVEAMKKYPDLRVEIAGHTDSIGSKEYNQRLSLRRAQAAYGYLISKGVDASQLLGPTGHGESRPIAPNTDENGSDYPRGRATNRRIEFNVQN